MHARCCPGHRRSPPCSSPRPKALSLAILTYNLVQLFQRHLGRMERLTATTLRFRPFTTGGILPERRSDDDSIGGA